VGELYGIRVDVGSGDEFWKPYWLETRPIRDDFADAVFKKYAFGERSPYGGNSKQRRKARRAMYHA
jgi:hypothetical protein